MAEKTFELTLNKNSKTEAFNGISFNNFETRPTIHEACLITIGIGSWYELGKPEILKVTVTTDV